MLFKLPNNLKPRAKGNSCLLPKVAATKEVTKITKRATRELYITNCPACGKSKQLSIVTAQILLIGGEKIIKCTACCHNFKTYYPHNV